MKKILKSLTTVLLLTAAATVYAQSVDFSGNVNTMWGITAPGTETFGNFTTGKTNLDTKLEAYYGNGTAIAEGSVTYNEVSNELNFSLDEAYVDYSSSFWGLRIGKQKVVWGKADEINITNTVFPEDSSDLFTEDSSLPVTAAKLSLSGSFFTVDALWIPFFNGTELPLDENNPLRSYLIPSSVDFPGVGSIAVNLGSLTQPEAALKNGEYGLKVSGYFSFCDVSLYGFYGWDKTPLMNYSLNTVYNEAYGTYIPESITVSGDYERLAMAGADAAFPLGPTVLRLEAAYFPNRKMQASAQSILNGGDTGIEQQQLMGLAGIDWMPSGWTITAQYYCDFIADKSENLERSDAYTHGATLSLSKSFLQETLELSLSGIIGFNNFDSVINASAAYSISDQIKISGGAYAFLPGPENDGTYGAYKDFSTIFVKCRYSF